MAERTVAVIGGGIAGLAAAWEATGGPPAGDRVRVVLLDAAPRLGGKLATTDFCGRRVDTGPDSFLGRRPEASELCRELGLGDELRAVGAKGAAVWARGKRRMLPEGLAMGIPTRLGPVARSGILSTGGTLRLVRDLLAPAPDRRAPLTDRAIGPLVARKLGHQVVDRLVDPLLGGINAGGVSDASAAAVYPLILAVAQRRGSFIRAMHRAVTVPDDAPAGPAFWSLDGGMERLVDTLADALAGRGVELRTGTPVDALRRDGTRWVLGTPGGDLRADGVVLALPAAPAAALLGGVDADTAALIRSVEYASVALVTLRYQIEPAELGLEGTGLLVPHGTPLPTQGHEPFMVTAVTYLSQKWPHLARPGELLVRASVGRYGDLRYQEMDDQAVAARVAEELGILLGTEVAPSDTMVTRWADALPQYRVHHLLRVATVEAALQRLGPISVAGALYRGVGIPACIASGRKAARELLDT